MAHAKDWRARGHYSRGMGALVVYKFRFHVSLLLAVTNLQNVSDIHKYFADYLYC